MSISTWLCYSPLPLQAELAQGSQESNLSRLCVKPYNRNSEGFKILAVLYAAKPHITWEFVVALFTVNDQRPLQASRIWYFQKTDVSPEGKHYGLVILQRKHNLHALKRECFRV